MDWQEFKVDRFYNVSVFGGGIYFSDQNINLRLDIPYVFSDVTFETTSGLGDIFIEGNFIFNASDPSSFITGTTLIFPTATKDELGFGKYVVAPLIGITYTNGWGFLGILFRDYLSYAGDDSRKNVHELSIQPLVKVDFGKGWYTIFEPDIRINWVSTKIFIPYTQEFGWMFNRNWIASVKGGFHLYNGDKRYDWLAEVRLSYLYPY